MRGPVDDLPQPPASLEREQAAQLSARTEAALQRQRRELVAAIDEAFKHIPAPLRGPVRRMLRA